MAEDLYFSPDASKEDRYHEMHLHWEALTKHEAAPLANICNTIALVHQAFSFLWTGCYLTQGNQLVLGPFQGPVACVRIDYGRGVCGTSWVQSGPIVVPDVEAFPGHIACSSRSRSEIVLPLFHPNGAVNGVLDIDSDTPDTFDDVDLQHLSPIARQLGIWVSELSSALRGT